MDLSVSTKAAIVADLAKQSKVVVPDSDKIKQIASISANNDEVIGELIVTAFAKVGKKVLLPLKKLKGTDTHVDVVEGMHLTDEVAHEKRTKTPTTFLSRYARTG
jgi:chaperonin GroEL (HSP60 family)